MRDGMNRRIEEYLESIVAPEYENAEHRESLRQSCSARQEEQDHGRSNEAQANCLCPGCPGVRRDADGRRRARAGVCVQGEDRRAYVFYRQPVVQKTIDVDGKTVTISDGSPRIDHLERAQLQTRRAEDEGRSGGGGPTAEGREAQADRVLRRRSTDARTGATASSTPCRMGGRKDMGEGDPNQQFPEALQTVDMKELYRLRNAGKGRAPAPTEEALDGRVFAFERYRLTLADGRQVIHSIGKPTASVDSVSLERRAGIKVGKMPATEIDVAQKEAGLRRSRRCVRRERVT